MAEEGKPSQSAPVQSPEPDLDTLLGQIPQFKEAFGPAPTAASGTDKPEQNAAPSVDTEEGTPVVPDETGLPPAEPLEEEPETPAQEEPPPEEPKQELPE